MLERKANVTPTELFVSFMIFVVEKSLQSHLPDRATTITRSDDFNSDSRRIGSRLTGCLNLVGFSLSCCTLESFPCRLIAVLDNVEGASFY